MEGTFVSNLQQKINFTSWNTQKISEKVKFRLFRRFWCSLVYFFSDFYTRAQTNRFGGCRSFGVLGVHLLRFSTLIQIFIFYIITTITIFIFFYPSVLVKEVHQLHQNPPQTNRFEGLSLVQKSKKMYTKSTPTTPEKIYGYYFIM